MSNRIKIGNIYVEHNEKDYFIVTNKFDKTKKLYHYANIEIEYMCDGYKNIISERFILYDCDLISEVL